MCSLRVNWSSLTIGNESMDNNGKDLIWKRRKESPYKTEMEEGTTHCCTLCTEKQCKIQCHLETLNYSADQKPSIDDGVNTSAGSTNCVPIPIPLHLPCEDQHNNLVILLQISVLLCHSACRNTGQKTLGHRRAVITAYHADQYSPIASLCLYPSVVHLYSAWNKGFWIHSNK